MNVCYKPTLKLDWYHLWRIRCCCISRSILLFRLKLHPSRLKIMYSTEKKRVLMMPPLSSLVASDMMIKCCSLCRQWLQSQPHDNYLQDFALTLPPLVLMSPLTPDTLDNGVPIIAGTGCQSLRCGRHVPCLGGSGELVENPTALFSTLFFTTIPCLAHPPPWRIHSGK